MTIINTFIMSVAGCWTGQAFLRELHPGFKSTWKSGWQAFVIEAACERSEQPTTHSLEISLSAAVTQPRNMVTSRQFFCVMIYDWDSRYLYGHQWGGKLLCQVF